MDFLKEVSAPKRFKELKKRFKEGHIFSGLIRSAGITTSLFFLNVAPSLEVFQNKKISKITLPEVSNALLTLGGAAVLLVLTEVVARDVKNSYISADEEREFINLRERIEPQKPEKTLKSLIISSTLISAGITLAPFYPLMAFPLLTIGFPLLTGNAPKDSNL